MNVRVARNFNYLFCLDDRLDLEDRVLELGVLDQAPASRCIPILRTESEIRYSSISTQQIKKKNDLTSML